MAPSPSTPDVQKCPQKRKRQHEESEPRSPSEAANFRGPKRPRTAPVTLDSAVPTFEEHSYDNYEDLHEFPKGTGMMNDGVKVVRRRSSGKLLVRKILKPTKYLPADSYKEIRIQRILKHPNIVPLTEGYGGLCNSKKTTKTVQYTGITYTPFCELGSLGDIFLRKLKRNEPLPERFFWHCMVSILSAITYLQTGYKSIDELLSSTEPTVTGWIPLAHQDLHMGNAFISRPTTPDTYPLIQLADFGKAEFLTGTSEDNAKFHNDVRQLLTGTFDAAKKRGYDSFSDEFQHIVELPLGNLNGSNLRRFEIRRVAQRVRDAIQRLDLKYVPLPAKVLEPVYESCPPTTPR
jgi:hypothetical protein